MSIKQLWGGRSTKPEVDLLMKEFEGVERDGSLIEHKQIEKIIGEDRKSSRYRTVVNVWKRHMLRDHGIVLDGRLAMGEGFRVLKAGEHSRFARREIHSVHRRIRKAGVVVGVVPDKELTPTERLERDHVALHLATLEQSSSGARKAIASLPKRVESLPLGARRS